MNARERANEKMKRDLEEKRQREAQMPPRPEHAPRDWRQPPQPPAMSTAQKVETVGQIIGNVGKLIMLLVLLVPLLFFAYCAVSVAFSD